MSESGVHAKRKKRQDVIWQRYIPLQKSSASLVKLYDTRHTKSCTSQPTYPHDDEFTELLLWGTSFSLLPWLNHTYPNTHLPSAQSELLHMSCIPLIPVFARNCVYTVHTHSSSSRRGQCIVSVHVHVGMCLFMSS